MNKARIKLAEAMGWVEHSSNDIWRLPPSMLWVNTADLPDPFIDANDDYAVLEWARKEWQELALNKKKYGAGLAFKWHTFRERLGSHTMYQIGDYARAACKVLGIEVLA